MSDPHPSLVERWRKLLTPMSPQPTGWSPHVPAMSGVEVVLFDIYGTVVISASGDYDPAVKDRAAVYRRALSAVGLQWPIEGLNYFDEEIRSDHERLRAGGVACPEVDIRDIWARVARRCAGDVPSAGLIDALAVEFEARVNPVCSMPGFPEVWDSLSGRVRLGIVSNAQFYTPLMLEALADRSCSALGVEERLCAWSYLQREAKPSPHLLARVLEQGGLEPGRVLVVGNDFAKDCAPARQLGCRCALFAGDARSLRTAGMNEQETRARVDAVFTDLRQIPAGYVL